MSALSASAAYAPSGAWSTETKGLGQPSETAPRTRANDNVYAHADANFDTSKGSGAAWDKRAARAAALRRAGEATTPTRAAPRSRPCRASEKAVTASGAKPAAAPCGAGPHRRGIGQGSVGERDLGIGHLDTLGHQVY